MATSVKRVRRRFDPQLNFLSRDSASQLTGLTALLVVGLLLPPITVSHSRVVGAEEGSQKNQAEGDPPAIEPLIALNGRIIDETGAPVADAEITISSMGGGEQIKRITDATGRYQIESLQQTGAYRVLITSERCVGIGYRERVVVNLTPNGRMTRDFTLQRACRLRVRTVDEEGNPVPRAQLMANSLSSEKHIAPESVRTDEQGWASVGGLKPSSTKYIVAVWHDDFGFEKLLVTLDDPTKTLSQEVILRRGKPIRGTAVCSDGKPPAGWRIRALPSWWHFGMYPGGITIDDDGSFVFPHIVPGKYDVTISVPSGEGGSIPKQVLKQAELAKTEGMLKLKMDHPSPASMVYIVGRIKFIGDPPDDGFWIFANSDDRQTHSSTYMRGGKQDFRIGPVPKGIFRIQAENVGIKCDPLTVTAPAEDVELVVTVTGKPRLKGRVVQSESNNPVKDFRVRVLKLRTLSGPNYAQDPSWRTFENENGTFEIEVNGPGIYQVLVAANGFAATRSDSINTVEDAKKRVQIELSRGVALQGTVIDEQGEPVGGATVIPLSNAVGGMPRLAGKFAAQDGAVETNEHGQFELKHLQPGKESLRVTHPDYCFANVADVNVGSTPDDNPLKVTLTRGATVRGRVYDAEGKPEPNVTLFFHDRTGYGGGGAQEAGRFATVVTDASGAYEARHLPDQMCYIHRAEEWQSNGVVRHSILPQNGGTQELDFGGKTPLTGRLLINGKPFADGQVLISGESPSFGIFKAYGKTNLDGSFQFKGIAAGKRTLYYALPGRRSDWGRVRDIDVASESMDLGTINQLTGRIVVRVESPSAEDMSNLRLSLHEFDPIWTHGNSVGAVKRPTPEEPFVIEHVSPGKYELLCYRQGQFQVRRRVDITADKLRQILLIRLPRGTASLSGRFDREAFGTGLRVWSTDQRLLGSIRGNEDGRYRLEHIPAGDYLIRNNDTRDAPILLKVSLADGEQRTVDFTPEDVSVSKPKKDGYLVVHAYTRHGVPLPCHMYLEGHDGRITPHSSQDGRVSFLGTPGPYTLVINHPGFQTVHQQVQLEPMDDEARSSHVDVQLGESDSR